MIINVINLINTNNLIYTNNLVYTNNLIYTNNLQLKFSAASGGTLLCRCQWSTKGAYTNGWFCYSTSGKQPLFWPVLSSIQYFRISSKQPEYYIPIVVLFLAPPLCQLTVFCLPKFPLLKLYQMYVTRHRSTGMLGRVHKYFGWIQAHFSPIHFPKFELIYLLPLLSSLFFVY